MHAYCFSFGVAESVFYGAYGFGKVGHGRHYSRNKTKVTQQRKIRKESAVGTKKLSGTSRSGSFQWQKPAKFDHRLEAQDLETARNQTCETLGAL